MLTPLLPLRLRPRAAAQRRVAACISSPEAAAQELKGALDELRDRPSLLPDSARRLLAPGPAR